MTSERGIAVIGYSCRFPGANNVEEFWENLINGVDSVTSTPKERTYMPGETDLIAGYLKCPLDRFDGDFFHLSARDLPWIDPQQRLFMQVAWESLENARIQPQSLRGTRTGVFMGVTSNEYRTQMMGQLELKDILKEVMGNYWSAATGRLSHFLGLTGPSVPIESTCASSAVALHLAVQSLRLGETGLALVGGVNLLLERIQKFPPGMTGPRCKAFDATANGFTPAEGVAVLVLKRLDLALVDGNQILGVIRGSAISHDGDCRSFGTPNPQAQEFTIRAAFEDAGISFQDVAYVETHGTGTKVGDPCEIKALQVFAGDERAETLYLGSVKTNIGHTYGCSGVAGLIKCLLVLQHRTVPPHLHLTRLNPRINLEVIPAVIPIENVDLSQRKSPLLVGLNNFGLTGTTAHFVLEEAPMLTGNSSVVHERSVHLLAISAKSEPALQSLFTNYARALENSKTCLADFAYSINTTRNHFSNGYRKGVVASSSEDAIIQLQTLSKIGSPCVPGIQAGNELAFVFTGQGAGFVGMGRNLHKSCSQFRDTFARLEPLYRTALNKELSEVLWSDEAKNLLKAPRYGQPANFCLQICLLEVWRQAYGIRPKIVLGHSVGEFAALVAAEVLDVEAAFKLLVARSQLLSTLSPGAMLAVKASFEAVTSVLLPAFHKANPHLWLDVAGNNSHSQVVLSGSLEAIHLFASDNPALKTTQLDVATPFHSRATKPILDEFGAVVKEMAEQMRNPTCTYVSGTLARIISSGSELNEKYWCGHCRETVQFSPAIDLLLKGGVKTFIEIGPQPTLLALIRANAGPERPLLLCPSMRTSDVDGWPTLLTSLGRLYETGVDVTWANVDEPGSRRIVDLPLYPFQGKDYWIPTPWSHSAQQTTNTLSTEVQVHPLLGHRLDLIQVTSPVVFRSSISANSQPWFRNYVTASSVIVPEVVALEFMLAVGKEMGFQTVHVTDLDVITGLELGRNQTSIQTMVNEEGDSHAVSVFSLQGETWVEHYKGRIGTTSVPAQDWPELPTVLPAVATCTAQEAYSEMYTRLDAAITVNKLESITAVLELEPNEVVTRVRVSPDWGPRGSRAVVLDAMIQTFTYVNMLTIKRSGGSTKNFATSLGTLDSLCWYAGNDLAKTTEFFIHAKNGTEAGEQDYRLRLFTDSGKFLGSMDGVVTRHASDTSQQVNQASRDFPLFFKEVVEPVKGTLSQMLPVVAGRDTWLVMASGDASALESALVVELETTGRQVQRIFVSADGEIGHLIPNATWEGMIYVRGHVAGDMDSAEFRKDQETACMGFINFLRLNSSVSDGLCKLVLVTIGADNYTMPARVDPSGATLTGILATFQNENPSIPAVGIDVDPDETDNSISAQQILSSALTQRKERSFVYRRRQAFITRLMSIDTAIPDDRTKSILFKADASYLVTGGTGGVGLEVAKWILGQGAVRVVLVGRNSQPASTIGLPSDRVTFIAADVSDAAQVRNLIDRFTTQFPPLKGIFHAAGVLADAFIENQNLDSLRRVFDSKVIGTWNLHNLTQHLDLDHFVLFSSISALLGAVGQSNYAAGNRFMDVLVSHRVKDLKLPGLSINWGAWENLGMAMNMSRSGMFAAIPPFSPASGIRGLERAMRLGLHRVVIAEIDAVILTKNLPRMKAYFSKLESNVTSGPSGSTKTALTFSLADLVTESKTERLEHVKAFLESLVRVHLRIGETESFDSDRPFRLFGMDSLMEMELRSHLTQAFGLQLDRKLFQVQQTLNALAVYFNDVIFNNASNKSDPI